jgi:hypothetical protein
VLACSALVAGSALLPAARAAFPGEAGPAMLASLEPLAPSPGEPPHVVLLNGQRLLFSSRSSEQPVSAVLDAFELECDSRAATPSGAGDGLEKHRGAHALPIEAEVGAASPSALPERWLAARHAADDGSVGQGACFARSDARSLGERLWGFVRDADLSSLGQARYVLARRAPSAARTHVLEVRAPGSFSLRALVDGPEAPPALTEPVPAPAEVELLLDARVEGQPHAVRLYASPELPRALLERYTRQLVASGFEPVPSPDGAAPTRRALLGPGLAVLLAVSRVSDQTLLSRVELARPRRASSVEEAP